MPRTGDTVSRNCYRCGGKFKAKFYGKAAFTCGDCENVAEHLVIYDRDSHRGEIPENLRRAYRL